MDPKLSDRLSIKLGDMIKYRPWRESDIPIDQIANSSRGWNAVGVVVSLCESTFGSQVPEPAIEFLNKNNEIILAAQKDVSIVKRAD